MQRGIINFIFTFFFIISSNVGFSQTIHEDQLGLENSVALKQELEKIIFDKSGRVDLSKVEQFRKRVQKLKTEEINNMVNLRVSEGKSSKKAEKKALEKKKMISIDYILHNLKLLSPGKSQVENSVVAKRVLKVWTSLHRDPNVAVLLQVPQMIFGVLFKQPRVPVNDLKRKMPSNLVNLKERRFYTKSELRAMVKAGKDLSLIDPANSPYWKNPGDVSAKSPISKMEEEGRVPKVFYFKSVKKSNTNPKIKVYSIGKDGKRVKWKMKFGYEVNTEYVASRISMLIGFHQDTSYYVRDFKIYFKSEKDYKENMILEWVSKFNGLDQQLPATYIKETGEDENGFYIICHEGIIKGYPKGHIKVGPLHKNRMGNQERRELRGQLLFNAFIHNADYKNAENSKTVLIQNSKNPADWEIRESNHDLGYSFGGLLFNNAVNVYGWSFIKRRLGKIKFAYKRLHYLKNKNSPIHQATYSDIRWMARYMVQITRNQLRKIVDYSGWPTEVAELFYQKMVSRRNEIVKVLKLEGEVINGKEVRVWDQVSKNKMNGPHMKRGKISRSYDPEGYTVRYNPKAFEHQSYFITFQKLIGEQIANALSELPFYKMVQFPNKVGNFKIKGFASGMGVGFNFNRKIELNEEGADGDKAWKTTDTLDIFFTVGAGGFIPLNQAINFSFDAKAKIGRQYSIVYYSANLIKAIRGNIKKVIKMPFKKKEMIDNLKEGEGYGFGTFIGLHFDQGIDYGAFSMVAVGAELKEKTKFLTKTMVVKKEGKKYEITKARSKDFTIGVASYVKLFSLLQLDFFSASVMLGKSEAKTFYFDLEDKSQLEAFTFAAHTRHSKRAEKMIPFAQEDTKYMEKKWKLGIFSNLGTTTNGSYVVNIQPDGKVKRSYVYESFFKTFQFFPAGATTRYKVSGVLDFADKDFQEVTNRSLKMSYEVDDSMTSLKKMEKRVKKINEIAGEKDFVLYDPNHHAPKHLGGTHIRFDMDFNKAAMSCIFEGADCAVEGSHTRRVKWALSWIKRTKDPIKKLKRAGRYLRRRLSKLNSKYVRRVFDYIGEKNISMKAHLEGSQLNIDGAILSERLADAI